MASLRKKLNLLKSGRLEGEEKIGPAIRETHEYARGQAKAAGAAGAGGAAAGYAASKALEDEKGTDLGEGAVVSYEDKEPAKKAKGGRPIGVGAAKKGYGAVVRKSVGGGLRGVGVAQKGFGAVKKAGKE